MLRRPFAGMVLAGSLMLLGCGKQESKAPPPPLPPADKTPAPVAETSKESKEDPKKAKEEDQAAFEALKNQKVDIRTFADAFLKGEGYLLQLSEKDLNDDGTIKPVVFDQMKKLHEPVTMTLRRVPLSDAGLAQVATLALRQFSCSLDPKVTDAGVQKFCSQARTQGLYLGDLKITSAAFSSVTSIKGLKQFSAESIPIGDATLAELGKIPGLESVSLVHVDDLSPAGVKHLRSVKLKSFKVMTFKKGSALNDAALEDIAAIATLEELSFGPPLPSSLETGVTWIGDAGVAHLAKLKNLKSLNLGSCFNVSDAGVKHLKDMKGLTELNLGCCSKVTDASLPILKGLTNLKELDVSSTGITEKGQAELKKALPNTSMR